MCLALLTVTSTLHANGELNARLGKCAATGAGQVAVFRAKLSPDRKAKSANRRRSRCKRRVVRMDGYFAAHDTNVGIRPYSNAETGTRPLGRKGADCRTPRSCRAPSLVLGAETAAYSQSTYGASLIRASARARCCFIHVASGQALPSMSS